MQLKVAHHSALLFIVPFVFAAKKGDPCDSKTANRLQFGYESIRYLIDRARSFVFRNN